jgi:hypothetical protein
VNKILRLLNILSKRLRVKATILRLLNILSKRLRVKATILRLLHFLSKRLRVKATILRLLNILSKRLRVKTMLRCLLYILSMRLRVNRILERDIDGPRAIDQSQLGPQVLQHAKDLLWASVRPVLLLSKACALDTNPPNQDSNLPQPHIQAPIQSAACLSVLGNPDIAQHIATFLLRTGIIVRDPSIALPSIESDAANRRAEEWLASSSSNSESNKRARK